MMRWLEDKSGKKGNSARDTDRGRDERERERERWIYGSQTEGRLWKHPGKVLRLAWNHHHSDQPQLSFTTPCQEHDEECLVFVLLLLLLVLF